MSKLGITQLLALTTACADTLDAADVVFEDGRVDLRDWAAIPKVLGAGKEFVDVDYTQVVPEYVDLDEAEAKQLADHFRARLNLSNDTAELVIEEGMAIVLNVVSIAQKAHALYDEAKATWEKIRGKIGG